MTWFAIWAVLIAVVIAVEIVALVNTVGGDTLTEYMRSGLLRSRAGSAAVGAFLLWLVWHWLFVNLGFGLGDLIAIALGASIGLAGWDIRDEIKRDS